jgi:catechol 2,3-dioxygenase-like lactoylglutathione lyase family enzyme
MSILDHVFLMVSDVPKSKAFFTKALAPLGITPLTDVGPVSGFGRGTKPEFWIGSGPTAFQSPEHAKVTPTHIAFAANSRAEVDAFHKAALEAGAKDFGAPGIRAHYHPNYYGAFVLDPDGHDIEAVFHGG